MAISKENRDFINSLIDYYTSESESYLQIAGNFLPEIVSVEDTAFGIITGCIYSSFLQAYQNQQQSPSLEDVSEFNMIIKQKAKEIKEAIANPHKPTIKGQEKKDSKRSQDNSSEAIDGF